MTDLPHDLLIQLKLAALQAVPYAQAKAKTYAIEHGVPLDVQGVMVSFVMQKYAALTAGTPLALTDFDDKAVKQLITSLVQEAEAKIGGAVGEFIHAPVLDDKTLKPGGLI